MAKDTPPRWDRKMQQRLARGEAAALGELYDRFASLVHSQAHRMLDDESAADLVTREVFGYVWENPDAYDPKQGSMRSWVARLTHRQSVRRLRGTAPSAFAQGYEAGTDEDGTDHGGEPGGAEEAVAREELEERVRRATAAARADYIVASMPAPLRAALELAYIQRRDYRQTAADLGVTEDEARRRLRLGLQLLSTANTRPLEGSSPPGYGRAL
ncbi:RNA polymerase sigma factor [Streptomyces sp. NPDC057284]|uniref:RNA polymerase sigma factor n=1 Tax=Streptomyces sp. NPDC057284 TaxID=3346083 RepID=UPI00363C4D7B